MYICIPNATLAQSVEQRIRNAQVVSSSLMSGSKKEADYVSLFFCSYPQSLRDSPQGRRGAYSPDRAVHGHSCLSTGGRIPRTPWVATLRVAPEEGSFYWKVYSLIIVQSMLADVWGSGRRGPSRPRLVSGWLERSERRDGARSAEGLLQPLPQTLPLYKKRQTPTAAQSKQIRRKPETNNTRI